MDAAREALLSFFGDESEELERIALRTRELSNTPGYDEQTTAQFLHGFARIVREALAGEQRDARDLYTESAAGVVTAEGRTVGTLSRQLVTFGVLLGEEVARSVEPALREDAIVWLARFMGEWTQELMNAVEEARR